MTPDDQAKFNDLVDSFARDCELALPFYLVVAGQNKSVSVRYYSGSYTTFDRLCESAGEGFVAPLVLTVVALSGTTRGAKVEIVAATPVLQ